MHRILSLMVVPLLGCATLHPWTVPDDRDLSGWGSLDEARAQALQDVLDDAVNAYEIPGVQAAVITAEGDDWFGAAGTADWDRSEQLSRAHRFRIASASKLCTATLILQAVDEGRLSLDATIAPWAPALPHAEEITVRQLLDHSAGTKDMLRIGSLLMSSSMKPMKWWEPGEVLDKVASKKAEHEPGAAFSYSNTNYLVLGLIAEQTLGGSLDELFHARITEHLGLEHTLMLPQDGVPEGLVTGWDRDFIPMPGMSVTEPDHTSWASLAWGSGGISSSALELARFGDALFQGELVSEDNLAAMTSFEPIDDEHMPEKTARGLGVFVTDYDSRELWGHDGQFIGFMSVLLHDPEEGLTLAIIGNVSQFDIHALARELLAALETAERGS